VSVQPYQGAGSFGDVWSAAQDVSCFVADGATLVRNSNGDEVVSQSRVFADAANISLFPSGSKVTVNAGTAAQRVARVIVTLNHDSGSLRMGGVLEVHLT
jgi:hypothetical protein